MLSNGSSGVCTREIMRAVKLMNSQLHGDYKRSEEHRFGGDMYTITIIGVFASIIILLMFRSIKPTETLDDQVVLMLASMQMRVEIEETARRKKKMKEAKKKAQDWLREIKNTGIRSLSRRASRRSSNRSKTNSECDVDGQPLTTMEMTTAGDGGGFLVPPRSPSFAESQKAASSPVDAATSTRQNSVCSVPEKPRCASTGAFELSRQRARSHLGFVPEIVVTQPQLFAVNVSPPTRHPTSRPFFPRQLSENSNNSGCLSAAMSEEIVFEFPDSSSGSQNDSPPFDIP